MSRISVDEYYLNIAKAVSKRSSCLKRQYGAVIVNNKEIIATGYNGAPRGETNCCDLGYCERLHEAHNSGLYDKCKSVHAEQNAIISASRRRMLGGTIYLYGEENGKEIECKPCPICERMIKNAGIVKIVTPYIQPTIEEIVTCKDCKYLMFSDFYGECSKNYKGIVNPHDTCGKGIKR